MSKLVSDLFDISELAHHGPENLFISLIKIVGAFIFLFFINWRLAVPLLFLVVLMLIFSLRQNRRMQATFMDNRRKIGDINARLQDTFPGSVSYSLLQMRRLSGRNFRRATKDFWYPKMRTIVVWEVL